MDRITRTGGNTPTPSFWSAWSAWSSFPTFYGCDQIETNEGQNIGPGAFPWKCKVVSTNLGGWAPTWWSYVGWCPSPASCLPCSRCMARCWLRTEIFRDWWWWWWWWRWCSAPAIVLMFRLYWKTTHRPAPLSLWREKVNSFLYFVAKLTNSIYRLPQRCIVIFRCFQRSQTSPFLGFCLPSTSGHRRFQPCDHPQDQSSKSSRERKGQVQENTISETDGHVHPDDLSCLRGLACRLPPLCHCRHCPWHVLSSKSS